MPEKTKRLFDVYAKAETRAASDGKKYIEGVIPYNSRSEEMWGFVEVLAASAFAKTLADGANVYAFWGHDETDILGATQSRTLTLSNEADGLHFSIELRDTGDMEDYFQTIARGDCNGVSFGFIAEKESWDNTQEPALRTLTEVRLLEVSPGVAFPAYPGAQSEAAKRSLYAEGAPEFRSKYIKPTEPLSTTTEPPEALESRKKADEEELRKRQENELTAILAEAGL